MDPYNPINAEQFVKHVPPWKVALGLIGFVFITLAATWAAAVLILSLERVAS